MIQDTFIYIIRHTHIYIYTIHVKHMVKFDVQVNRKFWNKYFLNFESNKISNSFRLDHRKVK